MPVTSYLVHPHPNQKDDLIKALGTFSQCEIVPAENEDVVVLVTDTPNKVEDEKLVKQLESIKSLKFLAMVSAFNTPEN